MEAVRRALDELGLTAPTSALQEFVKMRFGLDMTPGHVKSYKGKIRKQAAAKGKPAPPKPAVQKAAAQTKGKKKAPAKPSPAPVTTGAGGKGKGIPLNDILYVKTLVGRFGKGQLHILVDAF
jgi:hypothetical protein